jgi:dTMP kinase
MFITFEGMDGSGKTTQVERALEFLRARGHDLLSIREPGTTQVGERTRAILMDRETVNLSAQAELLLFCAARAQLVHEVIEPHLKQGGTVVCDRYIDSSLAYQGVGRGLGMDAVWPVLNFATGGLLPDLTVYLDIAPQAALARRAAAAQNGAEFTRLDAQPDDFHQRVYQGYQQIGRAAGARWASINADQPIDAVTQDLLSLLQSRIPTNHNEAK